MLYQTCGSESSGPSRFHRRSITVRPAMAVQIQLLGGFFAQRDGRPLALSSRKVAALLAILACQPGALHSRARLADLLWSRSAEAQARGSLRQALRDRKSTRLNSSH